jgi:SAM-dependent methyltransferase
MDAKCRFCGAVLTETFVDLGMSPPSNRYLNADQLRSMEPFFPLHAWICGECKLVQLEQFERPEQIFDEYVYLSSYSESWLKHAEAYVEMMVARFGFGSHSHILEIASNDGYLLQFFKMRNIPVLGVEPAANVAKVAFENHGIRSRVEFFGLNTARRMAAEGIRPDLLVGNNVLAHVPDINDFVAGMRVVLKPGGVLTMEFPHLLRLIQQNQFDTIYHEHFSYLSFHTAERIFARHELTVFDVEEITTHGGSLRIFACHAEDKRLVAKRVKVMRTLERESGMEDVGLYRSFQEQARETKRAFLDFLIEAKRAKKTIVGYGAPAKGNTLLNYCGVRSDFVDYVVDRNPLKQGRFLPGTHIRIQAPEMIDRTRPDYVLILPWNIREEVISQMGHIRSWGGRFVVAIPRVQVLP